MEERIINDGYPTSFLPAEAVFQINKFVLIIPILFVLLGGFLATQ